MLSRQRAAGRIEAARNQAMRSGVAKERVGAAELAARGWCEERSRLAWGEEKQTCIACGELRPMAPPEGNQQVRKAFGIWICTECFSDPDIGPLKATVNISANGTNLLSVPSLPGLWCGTSVRSKKTKSGREVIGTQVTGMGRCSSTPGCPADEHQNARPLQSSGRLAASGEIIIQGSKCGKPLRRDDGMTSAVMVTDRENAFKKIVQRKATHLWLEQELLDRTR